MSARRLWLVTQLDLQESLLRPFFLFWVIFMGWNAWLVSRGIWLVRSNSTSMGGNLAYVNSEFQIAYVCAIMGFFILSFFVAIAAGTPLIRDAENKVGELLHSTPLSPGEYVWGKFLGVVGTCLAVLALFVVMVILFTHGMPNPERPEAYGPFALRIYVVPVLVILLPTTLFVAGLAFALGRLFGRPILIFFVPVLFFVFYWGFFWGWNPPELSQTARFWFQMFDPSGFRWLRQNFLTVDRGIAFYNTRPIDYSAAYLLSRLGWALAGLALVDLARRHFAGKLKTARKVTRRQRATAAEPPATAKPSSAPLGVLGMTSRGRGFLSDTLAVARFEVAELFSHPALYVLIPLLMALLSVFFVNLFASEFQSLIYLTPGVAAAGSLQMLTGLLLLLLLFYTVESLRREIGTGAAAVVYTTPVKTSSLLLGKALANGVVVAVALLATMATAAMVLRNQGSVDMDLAPFAIVPLALGFVLWGEVNRGFEGGAVLKKREDYWRYNHTTWLDAPTPYITNVEMDLDLDPASRSFKVNGFYDLRNEQDHELAWFPVTVGTSWKGLAWTLDGRPFHPEDSHGLQVFRLARPLAQGGETRLGFRYEGTLLPGISRKGGPIGLGEFITSAGGVVTGRNPEFVPVIAYDPAIGVAEEPERLHEPKSFPPGWHHGVTEADMDKSAFTHRLRITLPAEYMLTSTGALESNQVQDGRRTVVWVTDYPVRVFNIAFGRWAERRGKNGTVIYYHPDHTYNVDSMMEALDGARRYFSEWFYPYPWKELRLNEFPSLAQYGRGNATNIFFSEGIGFLTRPEPALDSAFLIAAHEAAHSWWGHVVQDGEGPGGVVMSEGTAHFATMMLMDQVRGPQARIGFATRAETQYGEFRQPSDEKPLAETYRHRQGDTTVIYDKGCWAVWMLLNQMGREPFFEGVREYFRIYHNNPDHPVVQDFVAVMRRHAADKAAYDEFVRQWFFDTVIPEYQLADAKKAARGGEWEVTVKVRNAGTGRMPVEIAAAAGPRFENGQISPDYKEARVTLVLGAGEEKLARIRCAFEPELVVVDPDAKVMQLERNAAAARL